MKIEIEKHYGLTIEKMESIGDGQTSQVFKITTDGDKYVLKSQLNINVAVNEFNCLDELSKIGISPLPVTTIEDETFIELNGSTYILMKYIEAGAIDRSKIDFYNLGQMIKVMHQRLNTISLFPTNNRFDELQMIEEIENPTVKSMFYKKFKEYSYDSSEPVYVIHGDLGKWNLLHNNKGIFLLISGKSEMIIHTLIWLQ